jgi:hypothetical protein
LRLATSPMVRAMRSSADSTCAAACSRAAASPSLYSPLISRLGARLDLLLQAGSPVSQRRQRRSGFALRAHSVLQERLPGRRGARQPAAIVSTAFRRSSAQTTYCSPTVPFRLIVPSDSSWRTTAMICCCAASTSLILIGPSASMSSRSISEPRCDICCKK